MIETGEIGTDTVLELTDTIEGKEGLNPALIDSKSSIDGVNEAMELLAKIDISNQINQMDKLAASAERFTDSGVAEDLISLEKARVAQAVTLAEIESNRQISLAEISLEKYSMKHNDFIQRPGLPATSFSSEDTVIGVKDPSKLGGSGTTVGTVNISVNGARNPIDVATEIERRIASLA